MIGGLNRKYVTLNIGSQSTQVLRHLELARLLTVYSYAGSKPIFHVTLLLFLLMNLQI